MRSVLALTALIVPLAACGASSGGGGTGLRVTVWPTGEAGPAKTATVTCPGDPACDELATLPASAFDPVAGNVVCTQIYGGPDEAHVEGTLRGVRVDARFERSDGCEIARWSRVAFLLGRAA